MIQMTFTQAVHSNFELAFTDGYVFKEAKVQIPVRVVKIGDLRVHSGRISACDPGLIDPSALDSCTFTRKVPSGDHPAFISIVTVGPDHERVACSKVQFTNDKVVRWELALCKGQRLEDLEPNRTFGYGVDCGTGCFADPETIKAIGVNYDEETTNRLWEDMDANGGEWGSLTYPEGNIIAFHSGWGDGVYSSYFGVNSLGEPVCLATDFDVLIEDIQCNLALKDLSQLIGTTLTSTDLAEANVEIVVQPVDGKPNAVHLEVTGTGASSVNKDRERSSRSTGTRWQHTENGKNIEIEFEEPLTNVQLVLNFSKGLRALS